MPDLRSVDVPHAPGHQAGRPFDPFDPRHLSRLEGEPHRDQGDQAVTDALIRAKAQTETQIVRAILDYLRVRGCWAERRNSRVLMLPGKGGRPRPVRFGVKGGSDIIAVSPHGRFIAIEVKRPGESLTTHQAAYLFEIRRHGGIGLMATSAQDVAVALEGQL